ncbi:MAG: hypothetical protein M3Q83_02925 [Pseudomonadota bacterium]|nr:hypothetical protein [Pseudomonadota bacterium]
MKPSFLLPLAASLSLLACGDNGPVAANATAPPDDLIGDASATGLAAPENSGSAEAADRAAMPPMTAGMEWTLFDDGRTARYGPIGGEASLTLACEVGAAPRLTVTRHHPASKGAKATLSFTGGGHAGSLPVAAVPVPIGPGEAIWRGSASGDMARAIARPFSRPGQVQISLGGAPSLVVPAAPVRAMLADCA